MTKHNEPAVIEIEDLTIGFTSAGRFAPVVQEANLTVGRGESVGLVGESGCGKTTVALAIMGLLPETSRIAGGRILFQGRDLLELSGDEVRKLRIGGMAMIFQDPLSSLNPVIKVGRQVGEALERYRGLDRDGAMAKAVELMERVQIPDAERRAHSYPHQLSGGMRQRAMIAMALALGPSLLIADEPTTALDVTVQAQILGLLAHLQREEHMTLLMIGHDLAALGQVVDRVAVMYAGRIVEQAPTRSLYDLPLHPYTRGLIDSIPVGDKGARDLRPIGGSPPLPGDMPTGCAFHPRCQLARPVCRDSIPMIREVVSGRYSACHYAEELLDG
jgi:oligopeptide transport system ATP-binding protein